MPPSYRCSGAVIAATGNHARDGRFLAMLRERTTDHSFAESSAEQPALGVCQGLAPDARESCAMPLCPDPAYCPLVMDGALRARQEAGLAVLMGMATQVPIAMSDTVATIIPPVMAWPPGDREAADPLLPGARGYGTWETNPESRPGLLGITLRRLRADHLVRNSLYLMLNFAVQGALGFGFWVIMARIYSTEDVGIASSLISATALIAYFALLGLNSTLVRYLPTARQSGALITAALLLVGGCGALIGLVYLLLTPVLAPRLAFVEGDPAFAVGFVLLAAATAVNMLTDSVFIARRKSGFCALTDGAIGGLSKILLGVLLVGTGAYGLFSASVGGLAVAAIASIVMMLAVLQWRPSLREPFRALRPLLKFSGANYAANAMNILPSIAVPLIILDRLGARPAAYYYIAFQMASLLYAAVYSVEQAFLAEGSQAEADWREVRRRSWRVGVVLLMPAGIVVAVASHWILLAFGPAYSKYGTGSLELLAVAVIPIAICNWSWTVLRLLNRLRALVLCTTVWASGVCALAWVLAPRGLTALTVAWPVGCSIGAVVSLVVSATPSKVPARHRRRTQGRPAARAMRSAR